MAITVARLSAKDGKDRISPIADGGMVRSVAESLPCKVQRALSLRHRSQARLVLQVRKRHAQLGLTELSRRQLQDCFREVGCRLAAPPAGPVRDDRLADGFAIVAQVICNQLGLHPTDEQLLAGLHLFRGRVVEMKAGEGKTAAIAFPAALYAGMGRSVHIITANDYLAARDRELLAPVYQALGISVGTLLETMEPAERRSAYANSVVYGTMRELGFDYLRDNLTVSLSDQLQVSYDIAIVDEADQALIDEARTPLIISGAPARGSRVSGRARQAVAGMVAQQTRQAAEWTEQLGQLPAASMEYVTLLGRLLVAQPHNEAFRELAANTPRSFRRALSLLYPDGSDYPDASLVDDLFYLVDPEERFFTLTARGVAFLENWLGSLYDLSGVEPDGKAANGVESRRMARRLALVNQVHQLLRATLLLRRGRDYLVDEEGVTLIDRYTGRPRSDTRYQEGLQPALEAKEGVYVSPDCPSLAQITVQGFVHRYRTLAGITGTALSAADEFQRSYGLTAVSVPLTRPSRRQDQPSRVYLSSQEKLAAVADQAAYWQRLGRPVLVGVQSVEQSEEMSRILQQRSIPHRVLNAVTCLTEAEIVRRAGSFGAVTIATSMAGRGTDIILEPDLNQRILERFVSGVCRRIRQDGCRVVVRCGSRQESRLLAEAVAHSLGDSVAVGRSSRPGQEELALVPKTDKGEITRREQVDQPLEFGLGLYVINTEFAHSLRVDLQLKGRSGRQGDFGATRCILSRDDQRLAFAKAPMERLTSSRKTDAAGRVYFEGHRVEKRLYRLQRRAEEEEAVVRSVLHDYAAVLDAHTETYYRNRQAILENREPLPNLERWLRQLARRLVASSFDGFDGAGYQLRFAAMAQALAQRFGVAGAGLRGVALDELPGNLAKLLNRRFKAMEQQVGAARFTSLARLWMLEAGDEVWREYQALLGPLAAVSRLGQYGHKSAVADYIIHAGAERDAMQAEALDRFFSRLLTFPVESLTNRSEYRNGDENEADPELAALLARAA